MSGSARLAGGLLLIPVALLAREVARDAHLEAPAPPPIVHDRAGAFLTQAGHRADGRTEYGYWTTPPRVVAATLALEDRRFWQHPGVDPVAIARAAWSRLHGGRSGASTIAMQVARDAAVDPAGPARRYGLGLAVGAGDGARLVAGFLSDPMARLPSFPRYGPSEYPFTVALKTGTSQ